MFLIWLFIYYFSCSVAYNSNSYLAFSNVSFTPLVLYIFYISSKSVKVVFGIILSPITLSYYLNAATSFSISSNYAFISVNLFVCNYSKDGL